MSVCGPETIYSIESRETAEILGSAEKVMSSPKIVAYICRYTFVHRAMDMSPLNHPDDLLLLHRNEGYTGVLRVSGLLEKYAVRATLTASEIARSA